MGKPGGKSVVATVQMLQVLDDLLAGNGFDIPLLAQTIDVDEKTIRLYIKRLRALGQRIEFSRQYDNSVVWRYVGSGRLFAPHRARRNPMKDDLKAAIMRDIAAGHAMNDMINTHKCSRGTIYNIAAAAGMKVARVSRAHASTLKILAALINTDRTLVDIAAEHRVTFQAVQRLQLRAIAAGLPVRTIKKRST